MHRLSSEVSQKEKRKEKRTALRAFVQITRRIYITRARVSEIFYRARTLPLFSIEISQSPRAVQRDEECTDRRARSGRSPEYFCTRKCSSLAQWRARFEERSTVDPRMHMQFDRCLLSSSRSVETVWRRSVPEGLTPAISYREYTYTPGYVLLRYRSRLIHRGFMLKLFRMHLDYFFMLIPVCGKSRVVKDDREPMASQRTVFFDIREGEKGSPPSAIAGIERKVHRLCREFFFYRQTNLSESLDRAPSDCCRKSRLWN